MWDVFTTVANNVGMGFEYIALLLVVIGCLIFMARSFKLGLIMLFIFSSGLFMWFYQDGSLKWQYPLIIFFMSLIILSLTLYSEFKASKSPYGGMI